MSTIRTITDPETGVSGEVNRTYEHYEPDSEILVTLECGFKARFWLQNKPDLYYLQTTIYFKQNNI